MPPPNAALRLSLLTEGDPGQRTGGYLYQRRMAAMAGARGARIEFASIGRHAFPRAVLQARSVLRRVRDADALLLDSIVAAQCAPWLHRAGEPPLIAIVHQRIGGVDHGPIRAMTQPYLDRLAYRQARALIVPSEYLRDRLVEAGFDRNRILVIRPGRDLDEVVTAPPRDLRQGRQAALLCVANWTPNKGIHLLLDAVARLPGESATLHLVGDVGLDPAYGRRVRARVSRDDLRPRVVIHGSLGQPDIATMYAAADVFVLPSLREAYGAVCGEAMAAGLPVVAFRTDNLPYLVRDGVDGILTPPGDIAALSSALARLCLDPELRRHAGSSAQARAGAWPTWDQTADRFFDAIRQVVARP